MLLASTLVDADCWFVCVVEEEEENRSRTIVAKNKGENCILSRLSLAVLQKTGRKDLFIAKFFLEFSLRPGTN